MTETRPLFLFQIFKEAGMATIMESDEVTYGQYCTFSSNFGQIHPQMSDFVQLSCNFRMLMMITFIQVLEHSILF